jgi:hypothetical protein
MKEWKTGFHETEDSPCANRATTKKRFLRAPDFFVVLIVAGDRAGVGTSLEFGHVTCFSTG